jgi:hypothetical protein
VQRRQIGLEHDRALGQLSCFSVPPRVKGRRALRVEGIYLCRTIVWHAS